MTVDGGVDGRNGGVEGDAGGQGVDGGVDGGAGGPRAVIAKKRKSSVC